MEEGRMVDLLLVRLSRDDEKQKVIDLLVSELGMTGEQATEKVENSPSILRENVEMEQGRILQDRMYPFVDLLPKYYRSGTESTSQSAPVHVEENREETAGTAPEEPDDYSIQHGFESIKQGPEDEDDGLGDIVHDQSEIMDDGYGSFGREDDESLIITSAAEEVITVDRCHICGRTPTNGEKLVPCTACGELTCVRCYNRKQHVCEKCAAMGKTVDRPLDAPPDREPVVHAPQGTQTPRRTAPARNASSSRRASSSGLSPAVIAVSALLLMALAFVLLDPLDMLSSEGDSGNGGLTVIPDTPGTGGSDTLSTGGRDTSEVAHADTDLVAGDSLSAGPHALTAAVSLRDLRLPDSLEVPPDFTVPRALENTRIPGIVVQAESLQFLALPLGQLSAVFSIELDGFSLIRTEEGHDILLMSILHPEPAEKRAALLGSLGSILDSTIVDQMVLYYRENQYYDPNMFSFTSDSFSVLSRSTSPYFLQRRQALIPETTELISGVIFEWMTDLD